MPMKPSDLPSYPTVVAVDTETSGLHPDDGARVAVVSVAWFDPEGGVISLAFPFDQGVRDKLPGFSVSLFDMDDPNLPESEWEELLDWLETRLLVFQNAKFDLHMLRAGTRHWKGRDLSSQFLWDTMVATSVLDPEEVTSLKPTAERWRLQGGGERDTETELKGYLKKAKIPARYKGDVKYDLAPWEVIEPYAAADTELTLLLWKLQSERLEAGEPGLAAIDHRHQVMLTLYNIEKRGIGYDVEASLEAAQKLEAMQAEIRLPFKPTTHGAREYFFGRESGRKPYPDKVTGTGAAQVDDEVMARLAEEGVPHAADYHRYTQLGRAVSMWYQGYPDAAGEDGRLRTTFRQLKVKTGRMSVERIQLQAIPKEDKKIDGIPSVRSLVRPGRGKELWNLDLSQAELRVAAKYSKCTPMLEMLAGGADLHGITTTEIFGIEKGHPEWGAKRDIAKRLTFGGIFQIGGKKFQATLSKLAGIYMDLEECNSIVRRWRSLYPQFGQAYNRADKIAQKRGYVHLLPRTQWQSRSYFGERDYTHTAWNRIVQGSLAEFNQLWMVAAEGWLAELGQPEALVLNVHDSLLLELDADVAEGVASEIVKRTAEYATGVFRTDKYGVSMLCDMGKWDY